MIAFLGFPLWHGDLDAFQLVHVPEMGYWRYDPSNDPARRLGLETS